MKITLRLPSWAWIMRLFEKNAPNTLARALTHGRAKSHREWFHGMFQASVEIVTLKDDVEE